MPCRPEARAPTGKTRWREINVGMLECRGPQLLHLRLAWVNGSCEVLFQVEIPPSPNTSMCLLTWGPKCTLWLDHISAEAATISHDCFQYINFFRFDRRFPPSVETIASLPGFGMAPEEPLSYSVGPNIGTRRAKPWGSGCVSTRSSRRDASDCRPAPARECSLQPHCPAERVSAWWSRGLSGHDPKLGRGGGKKGAGAPGHGRPCRGLGGFFGGWGRRCTR